MMSRGSAYKTQDLPGSVVQDCFPFEAIHLNTSLMTCDIQEDLLSLANDKRYSPHVLFHCQFLHNQIGNFVKNDTVYLFSDCLNSWDTEPFAFSTI